jgi:hypothetical protein
MPQDYRYFVFQTDEPDRVEALLEPAGDVLSKHPGRDETVFIAKVNTGPEFGTFREQAERFAALASASAFSSSYGTYDDALVAAADLVRDHGDVDQWMHAHAESPEAYAWKVIGNPDSLPDKALEFASVSDLRMSVTDSGSYWFSKDTLEFFDAHVGQELYGNRFFTASIRNGDDPRQHFVHYVYDRGHGMLQVGKLYPAQPTAQDARNLARHTAAAIPQPSKVLDHAKHAQAAVAAQGRGRGV